MYVYVACVFMNVWLQMHMHPYSVCQRKQMTIVAGVTCVYEQLPSTFGAGNYTEFVCNNSNPSWPLSLLCPWYVYSILKFFFI